MAEFLGVNTDLCSVVAFGKDFFNDTKHELNGIGKFMRKFDTNCVLIS